MSYICFETIGIGDRLGSQMGNFAAVYTATKQTGHKLAIEKNKLNFCKGQQMMIDAFEYPFQILDDTNNFKTVEIEEFAIYFPGTEHVSIHNLHQDINYKIVGRLDDSQYIYINNINDIQDNFFKFKTTHITPATDFINQLKKETSKEIVSLHFRRTDYLDCATINLSLNYYREALSHFNPQKHILLLFSDDIEYCKTDVRNFLLTFDQKWVTYYSNNNFYVDMCLMSMCNHNIIANSSFSFWAALLNKNNNKQVVYPSCWLKDSFWETLKNCIPISAV